MVERAEPQGELPADVGGGGDARIELDQAVERERAEGRGWRGLSVTVETNLGEETEGASYGVWLVRKEGRGSQTVRTPISEEVEIDTEAELEPLLSHLMERIRSLPDITADAASRRAAIPQDPDERRRLLLEAMDTDPELKRAIEERVAENRMETDATETTPEDAEAPEAEDSDDEVADPVGPFMKRRSSYGAWEGRTGEAGFGEGDASGIGDEEGEDPLRPDGEADVQPPGDRPEWDEDPGGEGLPDDRLGHGSGGAAATSWGDE
jgi:hypothetical protein